MKSVNEEKIRQNLIDAGCDSDTVSAFFMISGEDKHAKQLVLLNRHRKKLPSGMHRYQYEIDCLDYLISQIERRRSQ